MKAIILAAGRGQRLGPFTQQRPKCLLELGGRSLLDWQIEVFRDCGIEDIAIVKGYRGELITAGTREYWNSEYDSSNMIASLFCAEPELEGDLIVAYADIIFERRILRALINAPQGEVLVAVDIDWASYYVRRFGSPFEEAESLIIDKSGRIAGIGEEGPALADIHGRYIGLVRLSQVGTAAFRNLYYRLKAKHWTTPWIRGRSLKMAYMTDFLQGLIDMGVAVHSVPVRNGWIEIDSAADYLKALAWHTDGTLKDFFSFEA